MNINPTEVSNEDVPRGRAGRHHQAEAVTRRRLALDLVDAFDRAKLDARDQYGYGYISTEQLDLVIERAGWNADDLGGPVEETTMAAYLACQAMWGQDWLDNPEMIADHICDALGVEH
jgi:hypothetical protein